MRSWIVAAAVLAGAGAVHLAVIWALPRAILANVERKVAGMTGINSIHHDELPTGAWRGVPMPSPDLLYSSCAYDVSTRPLVVTADVPDTYWSVSGYADNTDNFFVVDDRGVKDHRARVVFTRQPGYQDPGGGTVVQVPTATGLILFRLLVLDRADAPRLEVIQHTARCEPG